MKTKYLTTTILATGITLLASCGEKKEDHTGHNHSKTEKHDDHTGHDHAEGEHDDHAGHDHGDHDDHHGHEHIKAGPNGGRIIADTNTEFYITPQKTIQITFLDENEKPITPTTQKVLVLSGPRTNPVEFTFETKGNHLISTQKLPQGNNHPTVIEITQNNQKTQTKFNLNLSDCNSCDNQEYACECHH